MKKLLHLKVLAVFIVFAVSAYFSNLQAQVNVTFINDSVDVGVSATGTIHPLTLHFEINSVGKVSLDASSESDNVDVLRVVDSWDSDSVGTTNIPSLFNKSFALRVTTNKSRLQCGYSATGAQGGLGVRGKNQRRIDDSGAEYIYFSLYGDAGVEFTSFAYSDVNNGASGMPNFRMIDYDSDVTYYITKPVVPYDSVYILPAGDLSMMYPLDSLSVTTSDTITGADGNEGARLYGLEFNVVEPGPPKPLPVGQIAVNFPNTSGTNVGGTPTGGLNPLTLDFAIDAQGKVSLDASTTNDNADVLAVVEAWDSDSIGSTALTSLFGKSFSLVATTNRRLQCADKGGLGVQGQNQWRIDEGGNEYIYFELTGDVGLEVMQFKFRDINEDGADLANFRITDYNTDQIYNLDIFGGDIGFYDVPVDELILRYKTDVLSFSTDPNSGSNNAGGKLYGFVFNVTEPVVKPPDVVETTPVHADTLVAITSDYTIRFDTDMESAESSAAISIDPAVTNRSDTWTTADEITISFDDLEFYTEYVVTVGAGVLATNGLTALADTTFTFQTLPAPPTVITTYPDDQAENIPLSTPLSIEFSLPMIPDSVELATSFSPALNNVSYAWNGNNDLVYIIADPMDPGVMYTGTISTVAYSAYGTYFTDPFQFSFTTYSPVSVEGEEFSGVSVYPNPVSDLMHITGMEVTYGTIYTLTGQMVKEFHYSNVVNVIDVEPGSYVVTVYDREDNSVRKLIIIE